MFAFSSAGRQADSDRQTGERIGESKNQMSERKPSPTGGYLHNADGRD